MENFALALHEPLSLDRMLERLERFAPASRAVVDLRTPDPQARLHLMVKANIGTADFTADAGSLALADLRLPTAFCVRKLQDAGCDVFGKAAMTELAGFVTTQRSGAGYSHLGGRVVNPHGPFLPGGSSSGSAAAVAAGFCPAALGTETSGSVMIPALNCGVWGFRPTLGVISRTGIVPLSHTFDTPGILARSLTLIEDVLSVIQGPDPEDEITGTVTAFDPQHPDSDAGRPLRLGLLLLDKEQPDETALSVFNAFARRARSHAVTFVPVTVPKRPCDYKRITSLDIATDMDRLLGRYATGSTPRSFAQLVDFYRAHPQTHPFGMDRLEDALSMPATDAETYSTLVQNNVGQARQRIASTLQGGRLDALVRLSFLNWWSLAGAPSLAVPIGQTQAGKPVGMMIGTEHGSDSRLLGIAQRLERIVDQFVRTSD